MLDGSSGTLTFANPAQAGGSHFHNLTVLMSGTASNGGQLVFNGNLVIQDTAQSAPSGIVGGSGNRVTVFGSATIAQSRTAAVLTSDVLRFGGTVSRNAGAVVDGDTVEFFGTNQTVPTNLSPAFALKVTGDSVLFTGSTAWRGMLVTGNGLADIGAATVSVDSSFRTNGSGRIRMPNSAGKLSVRRERSAAVAGWRSTSPGAITSSACRDAGRGAHSGIPFRCLTLHGARSCGRPQRPIAALTIP